MLKLLNLSNLCLLLVLCLLVLSGCSSSENALLGYWMSDTGEILHFVDKDNMYIGTYLEADNKISCSYDLLSSDKISYRVEDTVYVYKFKVDTANRTLTLYAGDIGNEKVVNVYYGADFMQEEIAVGLTINNR